MHIPTHAIALSWFIGSCIALIPLGSNAAFLNIQTISIAGLLSSYIVCISCRLYHRNAVGVYGSLAIRPPFCMSKMVGNIINVLALMILVVFLISSMFPVTPNPTVTSMNWTSAALGGTVFISLVAYIRLHKKYLGPEVERLSDLGRVTTIDGEIESKRFDDDISRGIAKGY